MSFTFDDPTNAISWKNEGIELLQRASGLTLIACPRCTRPKIAQYVCQHCADELGISDSDIDSMSGNDLD